ncbi:MAG TPA: DUF4271 domain-containing protein [Parafilimonas sp.]|nr:DUF4271 domain-containing protein [Parafilimonas sp.]
MRYFILIFGLTLTHCALAQDTSVVPQITDSTSVVKPDSGVQNVGTSDTIKSDSVAAVNDTGRAFRRPDSARTARTDSIVSIAAPQMAVKKDSLLKKAAVQLKAGAKRNVPDRDIVFFVLVFILFFLGLIRTAFPKYFNSIFSLSFQATFRQTQTRDQMAQNVMPAFMLNILFILSGGLFITLFAEFNQWATTDFWQLFVYSTSILAMIYLIKYFVIVFTGWVFNASDSAAEYRFIVFLINKLIGILLIPSLFLMTYADDEIKKISITIGICIAVFMIVLRYLVSVARIRKNLRITAFHFFIYLCAVEIMPLLVIYKILFLRTGNT